MRSDDIVAVLHGIYAQKVYVDGGEVRASCPFSPFRHAHRRDRKPSFGIRAESNAASPWSCFSCTIGGRSMRSFVRQIETYYCTPMPGLWNWVSEREPRSTEQPLPQAIRLEAMATEDLIVDPATIKPFMTGTPIKILNECHMEIPFAKDWEVGCDPMNNRAVFPVRRFDGALVGAIGKNLLDKEETKLWEQQNRRTLAKYLPYYPHWEKSRFLYGERCPDRDVTTAVIVEGPLDVLALRAMGILSVYGLMGNNLSHEQMYKLSEFGKKDLVLLLDADEGGELGRMKILNRIRGKFHALEFKRPVREVKNPRDLTLTEVKEGILQAKPVA